MAVIVHDPDVTELELTNRVVLEPGKTYLLQIKETMIKRLAHPFPSNCAHFVEGGISIQSFIIYLIPFNFRTL